MMRKEIVIGNVGAEVSNARIETLWQLQQSVDGYFYNCLLDLNPQNVLFETLFVVIEQERYAALGLISIINQPIEHCLIEELIDA